MTKVHQLQTLAKTRSKKEHRTAAAAAAVKELAKYKLCVAAQTPAATTIPTATTDKWDGLCRDAKGNIIPCVAQIPTPETVVGAVPAGYVAPTQSAGTPLPVPAPTVYDTPAAGGTDYAVAAPKVVAECELAPLGLLPMTYSDDYGPMKVLQVFCSASAQAQPTQQAQQTQQTAAGFDTSSAELWGD
jgi:hypothetical protein